MVLDYWFATVDDVSQVDERISQLEAQRSKLTAGAEDTRATDLASQIQLAINNEDLATLSALSQSYGNIPALSTAKSIAAQRMSLMLLRRQMLVYEDLKAKLTGEYDFALLKAVKEQALELTESECCHDILTRIDSIVLAHKTEFSEQFAESLHGAQWLKVAVLSPGLIQRFQRLVNAQSLLSVTPEYPEPIWAFTIIAHNFKVSFDYHFNSMKQTNRIDKPELFFRYLLTYLLSNLSKINRLFPLADTEFSDRFSHSEFITSALVPVREKLQHFITILRGSTETASSEPDLRLLIHLIKETVAFDDAIVNRYFYDPSNDGIWPGLIVNFTYSDLEKWLNLEIKLSHSNFATIVDAPNVFQIDYSSVSDYELKPTVSAIKLKFLFEATTKTFQRLFISNYENNGALQKFKLKLFSKTFLRFLEMYHRRLEEGATAFAELFRKTRSLLRSTKRTEDEVEISGVNGLDCLFRLYCSLKYTIKSINAWKHELIFIELNSLYNKYADSKTSSLFNSILAEYMSLEEKVYELIIQFYGKSIESLLKNYVNLNNWNTHRQPQTFSLSGELVPLLDNIAELSAFSSKIVTKYDYTRIQNSISLKIANHLFQYVIKDNHFSHVGLKQLTLDFTTVWEKLQLKRNFPKYQKLVETFKVLSITDDEVTIYGPYTRVTSFARSGEFGLLKQALNLQHLKDGDLLDILLRIS